MGYMEKPKFDGTDTSGTSILTRRSSTARTAITPSTGMNSLYAKWTPQQLADQLLTLRRQPQTPEVKAEMELIYRQFN